MARLGIIYEFQTISEFQADLKDGNTQSLSQRISTASEMTGMSPEGLNKFVNDTFGN